MNNFPKWSTKLSQYSSVFIFNKISVFAIHLISLIFCLFSSFDNHVCYKKKNTTICKQRKPFYFFLICLQNISICCTVIKSHVLISRFSSTDFSPSQKIYSWNSYSMSVVFQVLEFKFLKICMFSSIFCMSFVFSIYLNLALTLY